MVMKKTMLSEREEDPGEQKRKTVTKGRVSAWKTRRTLTDLAPSIRNGNITMGKSCWRFAPDVRAWCCYGYRVVAMGTVHEWLEQVNINGDGKITISMLNIKNKCTMSVQVFFLRLYERYMFLSEYFESFLIVFSFSRSCQFVHICLIIKSYNPTPAESM